MATKQKPSPGPKTLTESAFQKLSRDVVKLLDSAEQSASADKLGAYWKVGQRIARERLEAQAGYRNSILRDLADASGLAIRTLQETLAFHSAYPELPATAGLSWSHYRVLCRISSKTERAFYEALTSEKTWTARQLNQALLSGSFRGGPPTKPRLARPKEPTFLYAARALSIVDADTFDLDIDLGFYTWTKQRVRLARVDCSEFGSNGARAARNFVAERLLAAQTLVVQSLKTDVHGRFVVHLFYATSKVGILPCFLAGTHLNDELLRSGHAVLAS